MKYLASYRELEYLTSYQDMVSLQERGKGGRWLEVRPGTGGKDVIRSCLTFAHHRKYVERLDEHTMLPEASGLQDQIHPSASAYFLGGHA
jgi:hypothetical protein